MKKLKIGKAFSDTYLFAFKNIPSIFGSVILWMLTIWIPYVNIGTSIAMANLPLEMASGRAFNPLSIFSSRYRKKFGDYLIYGSLSSGAILIASIFMVIPAVIIAIAWSMGVFVMIEFDKNPLESLRISNNITYGSKWRMCFLEALIVGSVAILALIIFQILYMSSMSNVAYVVSLLFLLALLIGLSISVKAAIWRQFRESVPLCE